LALLKDRQWDVRFAGDTELQQEIAAANLPRTEYLGMLRWEQLLEALSKASCLVMPTRCDTGPTVVKEARVIGLPVIGTIHGGLRDYIRHGESGWIVNPLDAAHLAEGLGKVMESHEQVLQMGKAHHAEDRTFFAPGRTAAGFSAIYHELAAPKASQGTTPDTHR
jgi:glycosyltransferase involved in cell wall biosynthesis